MDSPFPGMDPYLERFWNDVHGKLVTYIADGLNDLLPARFRASMEKRVIIADIDQPLSGERYSDVAILDAPRFGNGGTAVLSRHVLVRPPILTAFKGEPLKQHFVEIIDMKFGEKVVTAIEVLSPENKRPSDGSMKFHAKQAEYRHARVNRVEIDLLREGNRTFDFPLRYLTPEQEKPYYVTVYRAGREGECEVYSIDLRETLPVIAIPLRPADEDVWLDLQPLIARVYRNGRFPIDYDEPCDPPLEGEEAVWANEMLSARQSRRGR